MTSYRDMIIDKAAKTMAHTLDFAVHDLRQDPAAFFELFIASGIADMFSRPDIRLITGTSGTELAYKVLEANGIRPERISYRYTSGRSREYWTGWAIARYQIGTGISFSDIISAKPVRDLIALCDSYRDKEIKQIMESLSWTDTLRIPDHMSEESYQAFSEVINDALSSARPSRETRLKSLRLRSGYSQSGLAAASGVPVRTIQQYEQRQKDINKASFESIIKLAAAIGCEPSSLLE